MRPVGRAARHLPRSGASLPGGVHDGSETARMARRWAMPLTPEMARLTREELRSLTHGEFWIPESERDSCQLALRSLNAGGIPYVVSGLYALYQYTGIYRQ